MRAGTIEVSGATLETGWWGPEPAAAPTLVLLHEGLGSVALWRDVPERLAACTGWGVFAYSRFGYGRSDPTPLPRPMNYMHHEAQIVLPQVLRSAGVRQAVLIGHSDGGSIAAIYAGTVASSAATTPPAAKFISSMSRNEAPSSELALASDTNPRNTSGSETETGQDTETSPHSGKASTSAHLLGVVTIAAHFFVEDLNIASIRQIAAVYEVGDLRPRLARYHRDVDVAFRGWNDAWLDPRFRNFNITGFLPDIQVPVLALQGAEDPYGTDEQLHVLAATVRAPIAIRLIPDAKHSPHLEAQDATLAAIASFIADLPRDSST